MNVQTWTPIVLAIGVAGWSSCGGDVRPPDDRDAPTVPSGGSATRSLPDPCALLTFQEVATSMGTLPRDTTHWDVGPYAAQCVWSVDEDSHPVLVLNVTTGASSSWDEYVQGMIEDDMGDPRESGERVDVALFGHFDGGLLQVHAAGGWLLTLTPFNGPGDRDAAAKVGGSAAGRLP